MHKVKYGLFFDNHTHMEYPEMGKNFDPEYFTDQLKRCGVDYLAFHARCNVGNAYYNTKIGTRHPTLEYDLFGALAEACKRKGIALVAYFNAGISIMEGVRNREWSTLYRHGNQYYEKITPAGVTMCFNSPYRDHLLAMIKEVAENYPVEGFFIDSLAEVFPCVCPTCLKMMKELGMDWTKDEVITEFNHISVKRLISDITKTVKSVIPDPMLFYNGLVFGEIKEEATFFDCECLPTSSWGYEFLPVMAHYMRNIKPGYQLLNMTGRFFDWGDFGGLRPAESLKFDLLYGIAHGMRPNIGGHFHPRGDKDEAVFNRIAEVYKDLRAYDEWSEALPMADIAIVYPSDDRNLRRSPHTRSAVRMLEELKMQFDIVLADCGKSWDPYKLLILPENVKVTPILAEKVRDFIKKGGAFLCFGKNAGSEFSRELGIKNVEDSGLNPVFFLLNGEYDKDMENMYLSLYSDAAKAELDGAENASHIVKSPYNKEWNGSYALYYTPPHEETDLPFITRKGNLIWCAGNLFTGYFQRGAIHLKTLFRNMLEELLPETVIKCENAPSFVRVIATENREEKRVHIHTLAYLPEKRGEAMVVEEPLSIRDVTLKVLSGNRECVKAYLAPERTPLEFKTEGKYISLKLPEMRGYSLVVLEFA